MTDKKSKSTFAQRIAELAVLLNKTDAQLAIGAGLGTNTVGNIKKGIEPRNNTISAIQEAYNLNPEWWIKGDPDVPKFLDKEPEQATALPWRDEAFQVLKEQNAKLLAMVDRLTGGTGNFLRLEHNAAYAPTGTEG